MEHDNQGLPDPSVADDFAKALRIASGQDEEPLPSPRVIWKFGARNWPRTSTRAPTPEPWIQAAVPEGSRYVACADQRGVPTVWIEVPLLMPPGRGSGDAVCRKSMRARYFHLVATGEQIPANSQHRGTILMHGGALVLHLYELDAPVDDRGRA